MDAPNQRIRKADDCFILLGGGCYFWPSDRTWHPCTAASSRHSSDLYRGSRGLGYCAWLGIVWRWKTMVGNICERLVWKVMKGRGWS